MTIPVKRPCPCGRCKNVLLEGVTKYSQDASIYEETADEIIETYKDAERFRFLLANPAVCSVIQFQPAAKRRAWLDEHMIKPGRKKPK